MTKNIFRLGVVFAVSSLLVGSALAQSLGPATPSGGHQGTGTQPLQASGQVTAGETSAANAPAKAIGPAPSNSHQHEILKSALSSTTRQTLQDAMNSWDDGSSGK